MCKDSNDSVARQPNLSTLVDAPGAHGREGLVADALRRPEARVEAARRGRRRRGGGAEGGVAEAGVEARVEAARGGRRRRGRAKARVAEAGVEAGARCEGAAALLLVTEINPQRIGAHIGGSGGQADALEAGAAVG